MTTQSRITVGQDAPPFEAHAVVDGSIKEISLSPYTTANHWVILIFFPKAWSFICPTEIRAFSARLQEFLYIRSCAVLFASTDSVSCLKAWNATAESEGGLGGIHVPLISDSCHKLCRDYGVLIEETGAAQRAFFIIDPKGVIRGITINDADVGRSVDETLRVLDALIFKDEFGEGCPADWKKGDAGMDIASRNKVEGPIDVRKSWTEWARPKLQRAWSGTSQGPVGLASSDYGGLRITSTPRHLRAASSGQQTPALSTVGEGNKFESEMNAAMAQQKLQNAQSAGMNQVLTLAD